MSLPYVCLRCRQNPPQSLFNHSNVVFTRGYIRPSFAPKPILDFKHIRQNPGLYEQNALDRNYQCQARNSWRILELHNELAQKREDVLESRRRNNALGKEIQQKAGSGAEGKDVLVEEARKLKEDLQQFERWENAAKGEMEELALEIPNLSSLSTPSGSEPHILGYINDEISPQRVHGRSHVDIGKELDILDFEASATTSGWGWYFLKNEGALLEQALVQFALSVAVQKGWNIVTPPSLVYSHIASACGFLPRDQNGETQVYQIDGQQDGTERPNLVLAGTAEIPFAASQANKTLQASDLPLKIIGPSRCYRAEAGARGVDTKGLYRVHEFTKVEMFAWTAPSESPTSSDRFESSEDEDDAPRPSQSDEIFEEMLAIQSYILRSLGLHARILNMPSTDLGASATQKVDIEAFFPSRTSIDDGYGEVTSASMCTDYQTRRLGTRFKGGEGGKLGFPHTLNGTAMAVPRVLTAVLENGWDEDTRTVVVPECLRPFMLGGTERIEPKTK